MKRTLALAAALLMTTAAGASAHRLNTLYFFNGTDGGAPQAALAADGQGNFYGTTFGGGAAGLGTVFKVAADRSVTTLYEFHAGHGAAHPGMGALWLANDGSLIGTANRADGKDGNVIYKLSPAGHETVLHRFDAQDGVGYGMYAGVTGDADGNLFGATLAGGRFNCGAAFRLSPDGKIDRLHVFAGGTDGCFPSGSLTRDANGNLYGVTMQGGIAASGYGAVGIVYKITSGGHYAILHTFDPGPESGDGARAMGPLLLDAHGNLYGTTTAGDNYTAPGGTVYKLAPDGTETVLHRFADDETHDGSEPVGGVIADAKGNLYGTTQQGGPVKLGTVFKIAPNGTETLLHYFNAVDGADPIAGLVMDAQGNLLGSTQLCAGNGCHGGTLFEIRKK